MCSLNANNVGRYLTSEIEVEKVEEIRLQVHTRN